MMPAMRQWHRVIGTLCGIGTVRVAPGTVASLVTAGVWYWWYPSVWIQWVVCGVVIVVGTWAADGLAKDMQQHDPSQVVIDECAGMWVALAGFPRSLPLVCAAFLLFRCLDIVKGPPMTQLERVPGGAGIMLDDLAAGLITRVALVIGLALI